MDNETKQRSAEALTRVEATIAGLEALRWWIDHHPDEHVVQSIGTGFVLLGRLEAVPALKDGARLGEVEKTAPGNGETLHVQRDFGGDVTLTAFVGRDTVCERVVTGTETVQVLDPDALAKVPTVDQVRDVVEWRCGPMLAGVADR